MLTNVDYDRRHALAYAQKWALSRNPIFMDFKGLGGDCTNFISQCVFAGSCQMNYTPTFGWYYSSASNRAPAWTGVVFFYNFITANKGAGPFAVEAKDSDMEIGDVIQLGRRDGSFYHTLLVTAVRRKNLFVSTHTDDALNRPLDTYIYQRIRYLHILGSRRDNNDSSYFKKLICGKSLPAYDDSLAETMAEPDPEPEVEPSDEISEAERLGFDID